MKWKRIALDETDSTNIYINKVEETDVVVTAEFQTAGRGQGSNRWESQRGCNLLFSMKVSPIWLSPRHQFLLSMAGALAVKDALAAQTDGITLKWPNDIYWHDKKISGTLIQTSITGKHLQDFIFGVGINVNQKEFLSDAPNPVSLFQILGRETDREVILSTFLDRFSHYYTMLRQGLTAMVALLYHMSLYRRKGFHPYEDRDGRFEAETIGISENGHLLLLDTDGKKRSYEFKEVKFIIK